MFPGGAHWKEVPICFGRAHHGERRQHRTGAEPSRTGGPSPWAERGCTLGEARCPDTVCGRVSSHERDHDRFVLRPSANHPCGTCASSSGSSARRASHGNACHASHNSTSFSTHSVCGPGTARRMSSPGISSARPPGSSSTNPPGSSSARPESVKMCQLPRLAVSPP